MRTFKATYRDRSGKPRESAKWYVEFSDHLEHVRRLPAYTDRKQSEQLGRHIERLVCCRANREAPDLELSKWLDTVPGRVRDKLAEWELLDAQAVASNRTAALHLDDYHETLKARGTSTKQANLVKTRALRVIDDCGLTTWGDFNRSKVERFVAKLQVESGIGNQTANFYVQAIQQFCRWMVSEGRWRENPLPQVTRQNVAIDRRHDRRALTVQECRALLNATYNGKAGYGMSGPERALVYRLALESGLRANELASLTKGSFDFRTEPATVTVEAGSSKRRRRDELPMRADTAELLKAHMATKLPSARAFNLPKSDKTAAMLKADLGVARGSWLDEVADPEQRAERERSSFLASVDDAGLVVDFHALRHTFVTSLARSGVHPKVAQALARHSTITLTMDRYSHTVIGEQSEALAALPDLTVTVRSEQLATGTDGRIELPVARWNCLADCLASQGSFSSISVQSDALDTTSIEHLTAQEKTPENTAFPEVFEADGEGFEPTYDSRHKRFSRPPP